MAYSLSGEWHRCSLRVINPHEHSGLGRVASRLLGAWPLLPSGWQSTKSYLQILTDKSAWRQGTPKKRALGHSRDGESLPEFKARTISRPAYPAARHSDSRRNLSAC